MAIGAYELYSSCLRLFVPGMQLAIRTRLEASMGDR